MPLSLVFGQELRCIVDIQTPTQGSDKQVYDQMKEAITKYMNLRKWTDLKFDPQERIKCRMLFIISDRPSVDYFKGSLQVQIIRPVFNSSYESVLANIQDKDIAFNFVPFQPLEFSENAFIDNLTSILNFYAYTIIGLDADSFELSGGKKWFEKANNIVQLAQNANEPGWASFDGNRNRYWLANNLVDNTMRDVHNVYYVYHRQGLDMMEKDLNRGRAAILGALRDLQRLNLKYPAQYITRVFLTAKGPELIAMFKNALPTEKRQLISIMENLDPAGASEYEQIMEQ